jgi:hypothetical protein
MNEEYQAKYGAHPTFVRTLMHQGMTLEAAKVMVALGHTPTTDELIDWFNSDDWQTPVGSPEMRVLNLRGKE